MNLNAATVEGIIICISAFIMIAPFLLLACVFIIPMCPNLEDCETYWGQFPFAFLYWLCIPTFFFIITMAVVLTQSREYFSENFEEYRCKPWFMPFVSYVRGDVSVQENFDECTAGASKVAYSLMTTPLLNASAGLGKGMNVANDALGQIHRGQINTATAVSQSFERTYAEADKQLQLSTYFMLKLKALFDKLIAMVFDVYYALVSMMDLLNLAMKMPDIMMGLFFFILMVMTILAATIFVIAALMLVWALAMASNPFTLAAAGAFFTAHKIAIGMYMFYLLIVSIMAIIYASIAKLRRDACNHIDRINNCCFSSTTNILSHDGTLKQLSTICPGDLLYGNVKVVGIVCIHTQSGTTDWYSMQTIKNLKMPVHVTGQHQWWDSASNQWTTIKQLYETGNMFVSKIDKTKSPCERWCLVTDKHVIPTLGGWFADYQETDNPSQLGVDAKSILYTLNSNKAQNVVNETFESGEQTCGLLSNDTWIYTGKSDNLWIRLSDIRIGEELENGNIVTGIYEGGVKKNNTALPLDQIVWDTTVHSWTKVYALSPNLQLLLNQDCTTGSTRHIITKTGEFSVKFTNSRNNKIWRIRDFIES